MRRLLKKSAFAAVREFLQLEAAGGILLVIAASLGILIANSAVADWYEGFLHLPMAVTLGGVGIDQSLLHWINDGLMAVFFLLVGLEIKREMLEGELARFDQILLPAGAAFGGMAVPALIYVWIALADPMALKGWAIASATDIAFSLGVLALLGARVPLALKLFLTTLAILDDLGAILIIAVFYVSDLSGTALALAAVALVALAALNRAGVTRLLPYLLVGGMLWALVLKSGVHATLAGVALAFAVPARGGPDGMRSPLRDLEKILHPWVAYAVLPLFAFANAGVSLQGVPLSVLAMPVTLGVGLGLFVGKQLGVFGVAAALIRLKLAKMPEGCSYPLLYGAALLCGIGFTMSLFIGSLAFADPAYGAPVRIGVMGGSLLSAVSGYLVISRATRRRRDG